MKYVFVPESKLYKMVFESVPSSYVWLFVRVYLGYEWLIAGWGKVTSPSWVGGEAGQPLIGFVTRALEKTAGAHPDVQSWYGWFLERVVMDNAGIWSHVVAYGELAVGIGLIIGAFTGVAAFFGAFMNMNYLLAGTVSSNPVLLILSIGVMMAWKVSGYIGLDRWLLVRIGTPWGCARHEHRD